MLFTLRGKAGRLQTLCCQGIAVTYYSFTLDALVLKPSDFCNDRGKAADISQRRRIASMLKKALLWESALNLPVVG